MKTVPQSRLHSLRSLLTVGGLRCHRPVVCIVVLAVFSAVAFGAAPFFLARWVSALVEAPAQTLWLRYFGLYLLAYLLAFASRDVQWLLYARVESAIVAALTHRLTQRMIHDEQRVNGVGLVSLTLQGAGTLLFHSLFILVPAALETISMMIGALGSTPVWMAAPLVLHTGGFLFLIDYGTRRVTAQQRQLNPYVTRVLDLVSALFGERRLFQRYARYPLTQHILDQPIQQREAERLKMGWIRTWTMSLLNVWTLIGLTANLCLALWFYAHGRMTVGQVVAVESVFFLILRRLEMWSRAYRETGLALEQCRDGMALLAQPQALPRTVLAPDAWANGRWNVLFGRTGSGKSTWLQKRWHNGSDGAGLLPQRPEILPGSIRFNLTLGVSAVESQMPNVLHVLDLDHVVQRLPEGLETVVSPGQHAPLSGGELQRLCLARVLLHWSGDALLLDEPTSAQSEAEEMRTFEALKEYTPGKTVWIVSHRPAVLRWADRVWECTGWDCVEERQR